VAGEVSCSGGWTDGERGAAGQPAAHRKARAARGRRGRSVTAMRKVFVGDSVAQAHLVAGLLEDAGIDALVEGEFLTGVRFAVATDASTSPTVSVSAEDFERARQVILAHQASPSTAPPPREEEQAPPDSADSDAAEDLPAERRSLTWFKRGVLLWFVVLPIALALIAFGGARRGAVGIAALLLGWLLWRKPRART
jgi:hypothetical protein